MTSTSTDSGTVSASVADASRTTTVRLDNETSTSRGFLTTRSTQNVSDHHFSVKARRHIQRSYGSPSTAAFPLLLSFSLP